MIKSVPHRLISIRRVKIDDPDIGTKLIFEPLFHQAMHCVGLAGNRSSPSSPRSASFPVPFLVPGSPVSRIPAPSGIVGAGANVFEDRSWCH